MVISVCDSARTLCVIAPRHQYVSLHPGICVCLDQNSCVSLHPGISLSLYPGICVCLCQNSLSVIAPRHICVFGPEPSRICLPLEGKLALSRSTGSDNRKAGNPSGSHPVSVRRSSGSSTGKSGQRSTGSVNNKNGSNSRNTGKRSGSGNASNASSRSQGRGNTARSASGSSRPSSGKTNASGRNAAIGRGMQTQLRQQRSDTPPLVRKEISAIFLMSLGILIFMGIFMRDSAGWFGMAMRHVTGGLLGISAWFLPFLVFGQGLYRLLSRSGHPLWNRFFHVLFLMMLISAMFQVGARSIEAYQDVAFTKTVISLYKDGVQTLEAASLMTHRGGGVFGGILGVPLLFVFQKAGAIVVLAAVGLIVALIVTRISIMDAARSVARGTAYTFNNVVEASRRRRDARQELYDAQTLTPDHLGSEGRFRDKFFENIDDVAAAGEEGQGKLPVSDVLQKSGVVNAEALEKLVSEAENAQRGRSAQDGQEMANRGSQHSGQGSQPDDQNVLPGNAGKTTVKLADRINGFFNPHPKEKGKREKGAKFIEVEPFDPWNLPSEDDKESGPTFHYPSSFIHFDKDVGDLRTGVENGGQTEDGHDKKPIFLHFADGYARDEGQSAEEPGGASDSHGTPDRTSSYPGQARKAEAGDYKADSTKMGTGSGSGSGASTKMGSGSGANTVKPAYGASASTGFGHEKNGRMPGNLLHTGFDRQEDGSFPDKDLAAQWEARLQKEEEERRTGFSSVDVSGQREVHTNAAGSTGENTGTQRSAGGTAVAKSNNSRNNNRDLENDPLEDGFHNTKLDEGRPYTFPPIFLLKESREDENNMRRIRNTAEVNARKLESTLESFGIGAKVNHISVGPAITRYELQPAPGIKVSRIVNLTDDIALNLASSGVRIEAPIPGKAAIGVEVPNKEVVPISLRSVLESKQFAAHESKLAVALGKDISGEDMIADLAKMPHVLIAGATGSGKSVCINSIVVSLLYKSTPDEVKLLMIDPKVVELGVYNGVPHLLIPVVTDPNKAAGALRWAVQEMVMRYKLFAERGVRDLAGYNLSVEESGEGMRLPQIVIIIDELADLMMVAPHDVEDSICRLAQMARAAGMHLVIATQRPSVNVITGVIKANVPSRIAFSVSSQVDSRTIIDMAGAEKLLGKGDMLYYPVGIPKPLRVKGCFISDKEVERVVEHVKAQMYAKYDEEIIDNINDSQPADDEPAAADDTDELLDEAMEALVDSGQASVSFIQRRFKVGYARAGRIIDQMADRGIISGYEGSKPRRVLITREMWNEMRMQNEIKAAEANKTGKAVQQLRMQIRQPAEWSDEANDGPVVNPVESAFLRRAMADAASEDDKV